MITKCGILFQKLEARFVKRLVKILGQESTLVKHFDGCSKLEAYGPIFPRNTEFHIKRGTLLREMCYIFMQTQNIPTGGEEVSSETPKLYKAPLGHLSIPSDMLTMQGSVSSEMRVGTKQGMLFKVLAAKNKKM